MLAFIFLSKKYLGFHTVKNSSSLSVGKKLKSSARGQIPAPLPFPPPKKIKWSVPKVPTSFTTDHP